MNDPQIAAALRARSPGALAELFDAYGDRLFRYCWCLLRNREIAQIALRDTLVVAEAHIARLADPQSLGPWLYSLARAECRRRRAVRAAEADEPPARPSQRDADSRLMAWNAVMSLEADELEVLDLACRHDVDLGLVLSLTAEDAQALLDRARRSLERALGPGAAASLARGRRAPRGRGRGRLGGGDRRGLRPGRVPRPARRRAGDHPHGGGRLADWIRGSATVRRRGRGRGPGRRQAIPAAAFAAPRQYGRRPGGGDDHRRHCAAAAVHRARPAAGRAEAARLDLGPDPAAG